MIAIGQSSTDSSITRQPSLVGLLHPPLGLRLAAERPPVSLRWVALRRPGGCPPAEHRQTTPPRSAQWLSWNSEMPEAPQQKRLGFPPHVLLSGLIQVYNPAPRDRSSSMLASVCFAVRPYSGLQPCPERQVVQHARQRQRIETTRQEVFAFCWIISSFSYTLRTWVDSRLVFCSYADIFLLRKINFGPFHKRSTHAPQAVVLQKRARFYFEFASLSLWVRIEGGGFSPVGPRKAYPANVNCLSTLPN
jgi:hypothetical protein